jgi:hypothetical protein
MLGEAKRATELWSRAESCAARAGDADGVRRYGRARAGERASTAEQPGLV